MRITTLTALMGAILALSACTKTEQAKTGDDVKAAAANVADKTHEAITSPEVKEVGDELKEAGGNAVTIAKGAVAGAKDAASDIKAGKAGDKADTTTTTVTTTTKVEKH